MPKFGVPWFLLLLPVALGLLSLRGERARLAYIVSRLPPPDPMRCPPATVIVPVKGADAGIAENLRALAGLDYPDYELIVAARSESDLPRSAIPARARVVFSNAPDPETAEKIQNLLAAVNAARPESAILAFADSDGCVQPRWLKALVHALEEPMAGASTGYRWHIPGPARPWSLLRSVWNAVIAGGFGPAPNNFAWGGAMALRRESFTRLRIAEYWKGTVSDDYRLAQAVKEAGKRIVFAPGAMVAATDQTGGREFLGWIARQMTITRFYAPGLWKLALAAHIVYCAGMAAAIWTGSPVILSLQLAPGLWKAARRVRIARLCLPAYAGWFDRYGWLHVALVPVGTWLWLYSCIASGLTHTIHWRGYRYRMRRPPAVH